MRARAAGPNAPIVEDYVDPLAEIKSMGGSTAYGSEWHKWKTDQLGYDPYSVNQYPEYFGSSAPIPTFTTGEFEIGYKDDEFGELKSWRGGNPLFESTPENLEDELTEVDIRDFSRKFRESNPIPKPTGTPVQMQSSMSVFGNQRRPNPIQDNGMMNLASLYEDRDEGQNAFEIPMFNTANYAGNYSSRNGNMFMPDPFSIYGSDLRK